MKKKIAISTLIAMLAYVALNIFATDARADVYVKVDANGNAIGGAIMCDAGTCGAGSEYSRLTLQPGESYVLQGTGQAGIGNNNPNTQVKVDLQTNEWTVTREVVVVPVEPVVINNQPVLSYTTQIVEKFTPATSPGNDKPTIIVSSPEPVVLNPINTETTTATAVSETITATVETITATIATVKTLTTNTTIKKATKKIKTNARKRK